VCNCKPCLVKRGAAKAPTLSTRPAVPKSTHSHTDKAKLGPSGKPRGRPPNQNTITVITIDDDSDADNEHTDGYDAFESDDEVRVKRARPSSVGTSADSERK